MSCKYILRFDDICPTIKRDTWDKIVRILYKYDIKPIIAVIPQNKDSKFFEDSTTLTFWDDIKQFQEDGWMIGMHGFDHKYISHNSGILGISANTEFAGVEYEIQKKKITEGKQIFVEHGVKIESFIAPSHSFDLNTIKLLKSSGINTISDGFFVHPFSWLDINWLPCQLWDKISEKKNGVYTVCYHITGWDDNRISEFERNILEYKDDIISPYDIEEFPLIGFWGGVRFYMKGYINKLKRIVKKTIFNR